MILHEDLVRIRQNEILAEAERNLTFKNSRPLAGKSSRVYDRVFTWLGNLLIFWGGWMANKFKEKNIITQSRPIKKGIEDFY